jgi:ubiquinone/menaquinone biosynthesis C-methylase UbiE
MKAIRSFVISRVSITEANKNSYNSLISAEAYSHQINLKKSEIVILDLLKSRLPFRIMLDIGVGGGRTTELFSRVSEEYIGVDYCENMVKVCREKYKKRPNISFAVADARNLSIYKESTFDFILFSFGGLDAVEHKDRIRILNEIWRVLIKGGFFCFSTSNLDAMSQFCEIRLSRNPIILGEKTIKLLLTRLLNREMWAYGRGKRKDLKHTMYNIGGDFWSLTTYCITGSEQLSQLKDSGFVEVKIFDSKGEEITHLPNASDVELYFLAKKA